MDTKQPMPTPTWFRDAIIQSMNVWYSICRAAAHYTGAPISHVVRRVPKERRPPNDVYKARALAVHALHDMVGGVPARTWLRLCCNYNNEVLNHIAQYVLQADDVEAVVAAARSRIRTNCTDADKLVARLHSLGCFT